MSGAGAVPLGALRATAISDLDAARAIEPAGARARALRHAAGRLGDRLREGAIARRVEVLSIDRVPCRLAAAVTGARGIREWAVLERRALYVELDVGGELRRVLVDPVERGSWRRTPWGAWWVEHHPWRAARIGSADRSLADALAAIGVARSSIDVAIVTQLRGVDLRALAGTSRGDGVTERTVSILPDARWVIPRAALEAAADPHEVERPFLVRDALERLDRGRFVTIDRDLALGSGAALIATPGWSAGSASFFVRERRGVLGWSSHGATPGAWSPYHGEVDGMRELVREEDAECAPRSDALSRQESRTSMSVERAIADKVGARSLVEAREVLSTAVVKKKGI